MINWINELVNKDGVRLGDDNVKLSVDNSKSASNSTIDPMYNPETGTQLKNATAQQRQQGYRRFPFSLVPLPARTSGSGGYGSATVYGTSYMDDEEGVTKEPTKLKKKDVLTAVKGKIKDRAKVKKNLEEASKQKMEEYVEDIVGKNLSKDVLDTVKSNGDIRRNGVPDIDVLGEDNPVLVRKVKNLMDIVVKNQSSGEQKGMILNYLINNIGTSDIPAEYKQEMMKKLR